MATDELIEVEIEDVSLCPYQPRQIFSDEEIEELAASIRSVGLLHPPLVRPLENGQYELVSGERRLRAAEKADFKKIPVVVRASSDELVAHASLIENVQRVDLNPLEVAYAYQRLIDDFALSQEELARRVGKKRPTIANYLRLLTLPEKVQQSLLTGQINMGHAKVILSVEAKQEQLGLHDKIVKKKLSVREAEKSKGGDPHLEDVRRRLEERLAAPVSMTGRSITISYYNLDDLDRLLETLEIT